MNLDLAALFDADLGDEISALRQSVRKFAADRIDPIAMETDREDRFPRSLWPEMGTLGLHGITVSEDYGGANMGYLAHCVAMEEVSRASASVGRPSFAPSTRRGCHGVRWAKCRKQHWRR